MRHTDAHQVTMKVQAIVVVAKCARYMPVRVLALGMSSMPSTYIFTSKYIHMSSMPSDRTRL